VYVLFKQTTSLHPPHRATRTNRVNVFPCPGRDGTAGRILQGTGVAQAVRPRVAGQRHQARAAVRGQGVVHVVGGRADGGNLPETRFGAVPVAVPVTVRVRRPVGRTAAGTGGRGTGGVQPGVRLRFRVLRVPEERVLLRPGRPPESDVRVPVRARVAGRTGHRESVADARHGHVVHDGNGRPDRPVGVRVRRGW